MLRDRLSQFWISIGESGLMNLRTAQSYRSACQTVLRDHDIHTVGELDVDAVLAEFRRTKAAAYSFNTMVAYAQRFAIAIHDYRRYLDNHAGWSPSVRSRNRQPVRAADGNDVYRIFTLTGRPVVLSVPPDLTAEDTELITEVITVYLRRYHDTTTPGT